MDFEQAWQQALKTTEIIRTRVQALYTTQNTSVPYILLSESSINQGDTVVRKGEVSFTKPTLILPPNNPQFHGFEFEKQPDFDTNSFLNFFLVRHVTIPSFRYDNRTHSLDLHEGPLSGAVKHYENILLRQENVNTGLIVGHEDYWQFSLMIFTLSQFAKNAEQDVRKLWEEYKRREKLK